MTVVEDNYHQWTFSCQIIIIPPVAIGKLSSKCTKLHTVAASSNTDYTPWSVYYCLIAPLTYGRYSSHKSCL